MPHQSPPLKEPESEKRGVYEVSPFMPKESTGQRDELIQLPKDLECGTKVRAKWGGSYYPAEIVEKNVGGNVYEVRFDDMTSRWLARGDLKTFPEADQFYQIRKKKGSPTRHPIIPNGTIVRAKCNGVRSVGFVSDNNGGTSYEITFEGNIKQWVVKSNITVTDKRTCPDPDIPIGTRVVGGTAHKSIEGRIVDASKEAYHIETPHGTRHWVGHGSVIVCDRDIKVNIRVGVDYQNTSAYGVLTSIGPDFYEVVLDGESGPSRYPKYCVTDMSDRCASPILVDVDVDTPIAVKEEPRSRAGHTPARKKKPKKRKSNTLEQQTPVKPMKTESAQFASPPTEGSIRKRKYEELNVGEESLIGQDVYVMIEGKLLLCRVTDAQKNKVRVNWYKANTTSGPPCHLGCKLPANKELHATDSYAWVDEVSILPMKVHILDDVSLQHTYFLTRDQ